MDKELIFSYRRRTVQTEDADAKHLPVIFPLSGGWVVWWLWPEVLVGERVNRGDAVW